MTITDTRPAPTSAMALVLRAEQIRLEKLLDAMPWCDGHTRGTLPELCPMCDLDESWDALNGRIIFLLCPDVHEFDRAARRPA